ncbi:MAG: hypothetical protein GY820_09215 [Gammaproteobacteria bacterium]|nr:hypothetical protein [Gammaproteobacteria bacterium]
MQAQNPTKTENIEDSKSYTRAVLQALTLETVSSQHSRKWGIGRKTTTPPHPFTEVPRDPVCPIWAYDLIWAYKTTLKWSIPQPTDTAAPLSPNPGHT